MPLPTIIYAGISLTVFILGLILYLTSKDFRIEDIFQFLPKMEVGLRKRLHKRQIGAFTLIILGFMATFTFSDRLIAEASNPSGGGPAGPFCYPSNIGTSACNLPSNGCDGIFRQGFGLCQRGNVTVTTTGTTSATTTVTYSPAFILRPILHLTLTVISTGSTISTVVNFPSATASMQAGVSTTWSNMPSSSVQTEIYGDTSGNHRIIVNWANAQNFRFGVNCITQSSNSTAYLTPQYSTDNGGTWTEISASAEKNIGNCPTTIMTTAYVAIPAAAQNSNLLIRIAGANGFGAGDVPTFTQLWLDWTINSITITSPNIPTFRACSLLTQCNSPQDTGLSSFIVIVVYPIAPASGINIKFVWDAWSPTG